MAWVHSILLSVALLLMLHIHDAATLAADISIIPVFLDSSCQTLLANETTDQVAASGTCMPVLGGANSVNTMQVAPGCQVTVYASPYCYNNATIAVVGNCMSMSISSYSVDCADLSSSSGAISVSTATSPLSSSSPSASSSSSSIISTSSESTQLTTTPPTPNEITPSTESGSDQPATTPSLSSSSSFSTISTSSESTQLTTTSPTPDETLSSNTSLINSQSSTPSPSPSSTQSSTNTNVPTNNGGNNNLSTTDEIVIGVVIPSVGVIVAVIFGVRGWKQKHQGVKP